MKAPVRLLSNRTVLRQQDGGASPRQVPPRCTECRQCKEKHGFPAGVQKVCRAPENEKSNDKSYDSSLDFCALEGARIPGPLIKRIRGASFVNFRKHEETQYSSHHRKTNLCMPRIICTQCNALQRLSSRSGVQKVCKSVQTGKTKPNGQINHWFFGRV